MAQVNPNPSPWFADPKAVVRKVDGKPRSMMEWHINGTPVIQVDFSTIIENTLFRKK